MIINLVLVVRMVISMKELRYFGEQFEQGNSDEIVWECERESGERSGGTCVSFGNRE